MSLDSANSIDCYTKSVDVWVSANIHNSMRTPSVEDVGRSVPNGVDVDRVLTHSDIVTGIRNCNA